MGSAKSDLCFPSAIEPAHLVREHDVSARELVEAHLRRIEQVNPQINAVVQLDADRALDAARAADPGFFRTELLTPQSTNYASPLIDDYAERRTALMAGWTAQNGRQSGDPVKLAQSLITIANEEPPRRRFIAGADAIGGTEQKVTELQADIDLNRERFISLDIED